MIDGMQKYEMELDKETQKTLKDMEQLESKAFKSQDYELLSTLSKDIKTVKELGMQINMT